MLSLEIVNETSKIVLNSTQLDLGNASLYSEALQAAEDQLAAVFDVDKERASFIPRKPLPAGSKAQLTIPFAAKLTNSMMGYYHSSWEKDGQKQYYTLTQFEASAGPDFGVSCPDRSIYIAHSRPPGIPLF